MENVTSSEQSSSNSRREFLKQSSVAAVSASVLTAGLGSAVYAGQKDTTIKIGLVGCGGRGTGAVGDAMGTGEKIKLVAVGDVFEDKAKGTANSFRNKFKESVDLPEERVYAGFDAYQKVINSDVDMVILATPPGFRPLHFEAAVKAGKHIFMEKPVAVDPWGVRKVLEANKLAKEKKLKVGVGLQRHHQLGYQETIKRIHDGMIGDIIALRVYWNGGGVWEPPLTREKARSEMEYQVKNWYYYNWLCGDNICEQHIHNLDVGCWVKGSYPVKCNAMGGRQVRIDKRYGEIYDHHYVEYEFKDGSRMYSQCRHIPGAWSSVSEFVHGTKGTSNPGGSIQVYGGEKFQAPGGGGNPYVVEHKDIQKAFLENTEYNEGDNGAYCSMVAIMGRMASYSGKELTWDQALNSKISYWSDNMPLGWDATPPVVPNADGSYPIAIPGVTKVV